MVLRPNVQLLLSDKSFFFNTLGKNDLIPFGLMVFRGIGRNAEGLFERSAVDQCCYTHMWRWQ